MIRTVAANGDDGYLNKLVKYVPVEGLAPFIPAAAQVKDSESLLWITFAVALLVGFALIVAQSRQETTRVWYWPFVAIAFAAWCLGASEEFRSLLDVSPTVGKWLLGLVTISLPALDTALEKIFK